MKELQPDEAISRSAKIPFNRPTDPVQYGRGIAVILGPLPEQPGTRGEGGGGESPQGIGQAKGQPKTEWAKRGRPQATQKRLTSSVPMVEHESPETILARNWSILGGLRSLLKDQSISAQERQKLTEMVAFTEKTIEDMQPKTGPRQLIREAATTTVALNGAAFGAALAAFRICWNWTAWGGERLNPYSSYTQVLYAYTVFWYAVAGAVIFVVARNVLNSISWK